MPISAADHRRKSLLEQMQPDSLAILESGSEQLRNQDAHFPFRPDSNFYYLTHFSEPQALLLLIPGREEGETVLFCQDKDPERETWDGYRVGQKEAVNHYQVDQAFSFSEAEQLIPKLMEGRSTAYSLSGHNAQFDTRINHWINLARAQSRKGVSAPESISYLGTLLYEMRLIKSPLEIELMKKAAELSANGHIMAMKQCLPGKFEYQLEAELLHQFYSGGSRYPAYSSIVGSGSNGCTLHYNSNNKKMADGDLVLIDAGAEFDCYAADITRTFPVNGHFSAEQKVLYELVLESQLAAIEQVKPGNHFNQPHEAVLQVLTRGLIELGLLSGDLETLIKEEAIKPWFMHRTGHWLGMDVHDVGHYKIDGQWRDFTVGMVTTIEPGLYITENEEIDPKWWNIGIRIEDDVLVTESGHEVLTSATPKTVAEIETLMTSGPNQAS